MKGWKLLIATGVALVGYASQANAQVSVNVPGVGTIGVGGTSYYTPYTYGSYVPSGFTTGSYAYPSTGYYYPSTGSSYYYPSTTYQSSNYPSYSSYYPSTGSSYYYPSTGGSYYYPSYGSNYYNPGWGYGNNMTFESGFNSGLIRGATGYPSYGYSPYYGGTTVEGAIGNYLGNRLGQAIFD